MQPRSFLPLTRYRSSSDSVRPGARIITATKATSAPARARQCSEPPLWPAPPVPAPVPMGAPVPDASSSADRRSSADGSFQCLRVRQSRTMDMLSSDPNVVAMEPPHRQPGRRRIATMEIRSFAFASRPGVTRHNSTSLLRCRRLCRCQQRRRSGHGRDVSVTGRY